MNTSSLKNKIRKRTQFQNRQYEYHDIGSLIKEKRKQLKLTQELISNGICSISYLSKIENNQITPNEYFVKEIMTKLEVDEGLYKKTIDDRKYLSKMVDAIFYQDDHKVLSIYNEVKDIRHNMVINICKLGYLAYQGTQDEHQYVMMLENLVQNMDDYELKCYLLFAVMMTNGKNYYKHALELLEVATEIKLEDKKISALLSEYAFLLQQELHIQTSSLKDYNNTIKIYTEYNNFKRLSNIRIKYIEYASYENPTQALAEISLLEKTLQESIQKDYVYVIKAKITIDLGRYKESTMILNQIKDESPYQFEKLVLLYELCIIEQDVEIKTELEQLLDSFKLGKNKIKYKIYYHYLKQKESDDVKEYLRDVAIPFSMRMHDFNSFQFYTEKLMDICIASSRYKEATQHLRKYQKEKQKIKMILTQ